MSYVWLNFNLLMTLKCILDKVRDLGNRCDIIQKAFLIFLKPCWIISYLELSSEVWMYLPKTIKIHLPLNILIPRLARSQDANDHTSLKCFMFSHTTPTHIFIKLICITLGLYSKTKSCHFCSGSWSLTLQKATSILSASSSHGSPELQNQSFSNILDTDSN